MKPEAVRVCVVLLSLAAFLGCDAIKRDLLGVVPPEAASDLDIADARARLGCTGAKKGSREANACAILDDFKKAGAVKSWPKKGSELWFGESFCPSHDEVAPLGKLTPLSVDTIRFSKGTPKLEDFNADYFGDVKLLPYGLEKLGGGTNGDEFIRETRQGLKLLKEGKRPAGLVKRAKSAFKSSDGGPMAMARTPGKSVYGLYNTYMRQKGDLLLVIRPGVDPEKQDKGCFTALRRVPPQKK